MESPAKSNNIALRKFSTRSLDDSSFRGPREYFVHHFCQSSTTDSNAIQEIELTQWLVHIEAQWSGDCAEHLTRCAECLGIENPSTRNARYTLLTDVVVVLRSMQGHFSPSIDGIVKLLFSKHAHPFQSEDLAHARQSVLAIIGYLTMLFNWSRSSVLPTTEYLAVDAPRSQELTLIPQPINHGAQRTVEKLLGNYGDLLLNANQANDGLLHVSQLNYFALTSIVGIKLKLVDNISSHLIFNPYTQELGIFAFPEYCAMRCDKRFDTKACDRLVADYYGQDAADIIRLIHQEILLSYRLIFGSTSRARKRIRQDYLSKQKRLQWRGNEEFLKKLIARPPPRYRALPKFLAEFLRSQEKQPAINLNEEYWPQAMIMDGKLAEHHTYSASAKFAVFGPRLLRLQEHCSHQVSSGLSDMWRDRRDRQSWITFWAVLIFGSASILLSFAQLIVGAIQLIRTP